MSGFQMKEGSGQLFKNDKGGVESRPDYRGNFLLNGIEYQISGWMKDGKKGKFMSLSVQEQKRADASSKQEKPKAAPPPDDQFDDDIPF